ncbi:MAG: hypothetical protein E6Q97_09350 [Desulfurellales bacterium]|nr:MAG: hypothetical protein E6Q97_09350 [Desulfurellales bacterium]
MRLVFSLLAVWFDPLCKMRYRFDSSESDAVPTPAPQNGARGTYEFLCDQEIMPTPEPEEA